MGRAGRITALGLLALLLGVPGLLGAACPMCETAAGSGMSCPRPSGPEIHSPCCGGSAPQVSCCDREAAAEPSRQAVSTPSAPLLSPPAAAELPAISLQETRAAAPLAPDDPPRDEGIALYTLHSVFLI